MSFLGIDFGASFVKGGILDPVSGSIRSVVRVPFPPFVQGLPASHREVDPAEITRAFHEILDYLLQGEPEPEGLVICSQMHGFVLTNDEGRALSNYHSWQDQRVQDIDPKTGRTFHHEMVSRLTDADQADLGREVRPGLPASQLFLLARNKSLPAGVRAGSLADFIVAEACGQPPVTEATFASGYGLFDVARGCWHEAVLAKLDLPVGLLPEIVATGSQVGIMEWRGRRIPCHTPIGDQQCSLAGVCLQKEELSLNIATGSQVSCRTGASAPGTYQVRPYFEGEFLRTVTHIPAGRSLNALVRLFSELYPESDPDRTWQLILTRLEQVSETDARVDLSFFSGAFGSSGAMTRLREENLTIGHLFLAALENMASNYRRESERLDPNTPWQRVVLSGGLAQKIPRLRTLIHREIPLPQRLPLFNEDSLRGLLILGSLWSGKYGCLDDVQARITACTELQAPPSATVALPGPRRIP